MAAKVDYREFMDVDFNVNLLSKEKIYSIDNNIKYDSDTKYHFFCVYQKEYLETYISPNTGKRYKRYKEYVTKFVYSCIYNAKEQLERALEVF